MTSQDFKSQTINRKQITMPGHTKLENICLAKAAAMVNFRTFQLLDFPDTKI